MMYPRTENPIPLWEDVPFLQKRSWNHDVTNEKFRYHCELIKKYPLYANMWCDGKVGGYQIDTENGTFITESGIRGIEIPAIVAFDAHGRGIVFIK